MDQGMRGGLQFQQKGSGRTGWPMPWPPFLLHVGASHGPAMGLAAVDCELADASSSGIHPMRVWEHHLEIGLHLEAV
jgi:hypothetical protein